MTQGSAQPGRPQGRGPWSGALGRITGVVYWLLVVDVAFLLAASPAVVGFLLLQPDPSNIPLYALCLVPVGPALSAAISTLRSRQRDDELVVWPKFWRAWWRDLGPVLLVWVPVLAVLAVLGLNVAFGPAAGVDTFFVIVSLVLGVILAVGVVHALVIVSLFDFRTRDVARLTLYCCFAKPLVTLGVLALLIVAGAVSAFTSPWVLLLFGALVAALILQNARTMIQMISERFTVPE